MNNTTIQHRTFKGLSLTVRKHWSGSTSAFVHYGGEMYHFDTIKQAKSFINSVVGAN